MSDKVRILSLGELPERPMVIRKTGEELGIAKFISDAAGLKKLTIWEERLLPGRRANSPHSHTHKEEILIVRSGVLSVRHGDHVLTVPSGHAISFLPGDELPHCAFNDSREEVHYLGIATNDDMDEVRYR